MRVLFLQASFQAAAEYSSHRTMAAHTDPARVQCYFLWQSGGPRPQKAEDAAPVEDVFHDFGRNFEVTLSRKRRALLMAMRLPGASLKTAWVIRKVRPDVIYTSQQKYDVFLGGMASRLFRVPHVIHVHYPFGPWLGRRTGEAIRRAPHLVANSEFIRRNLIAAGIPPERVRVRHEVVPLERYVCTQRDGSLRSKVGWSDNSLVLVAAGRLDPSKGHLLLFEAFAKVMETCPEARLLVCGTTTHPGYDASLERRVVELGLCDKVVFAGQRDDMPGIYAEADLFCLATEDEAFGMVFVEAMAAGLPTVALWSGGVPEIVIHGETGLLSPPGDVEALTTNLRTLLGDPSQRRAMGLAGKRRALAEFAPEKAASEWAELLQEMVGPPPALAEVAGKR
jgi:glycosyltransferase involved in cell wall biosynthesis